jgi:hypothetical protein
METVETKTVKYNGQQCEAIDMTADAQKSAELIEFERWKAEKAKKERREQERETYKKLVDEAVMEMFPRLREASEMLAQIKTQVYGRLGDALLLKEEVFSIKDDQRSHTFTTSDQKFRIILGSHQTDDYDDTVNEGIAKVKKYIESLAKDDNSKMLVSAVLKLLSRDQKGSLKASRVVQLAKMAKDSSNDDFIDGVNIIQNAYRPAISKEFVRAEYKNDIGAWVSVPLGMTEA